MSTLPPLEKRELELARPVTACAPTESCNPKECVTMDTAYTERCLNELDAYKRRIAEAKDRCRAALEELSKHTAYGSPGDQTRAIASLYEAIDEFSYDDVSVIVGRSLFHPGRPVL